MSLLLWLYLCFTIHKLLYAAFKTNFAYFGILNVSICIVPLQYLNRAVPSIYADIVSRLDYGEGIYVCKIAYARCFSTGNCTAYAAVHVQHHPCGWSKTGQLSRFEMC